MSPILVGVIGLVCLFLLMGCGMHIGLCMALVGFVGLIYLMNVNAALLLLGTVPFEFITNYSYTVLPLFLLMANLAFVSGIAADLFNLADRLIGNLRGGLAMATVAACAVFGAVSSSVIATSVTIGSVALPQMKRFKYDPALATASVSVGGPIDALMPPSSLLVMYAMMTETSIGTLFIAGIIPALVLTVFYIVTIYVMCWHSPDLGPKGPRSSFVEKMSAFKSCGEMIALIIFVLAGLMIGWFTPTEAGAVGATGALLFTIARRRLNWQKFKRAVLDTIKTTGMIYLIMFGAFIFTPFIALSEIPSWLVNNIVSLSLPPIVIIVIFVIFFTVAGTFMDEITLMIISVPIFFPVVTSLGFDPIWFGIIVCILVTLGGITPPYGLILFTVAGIAPDVPLTTIFRGVIPFVVATLCFLFLLIFVPEIVLFLPNLKF